ncbi:MAG: hypothetical protein AAF351_13785 [Pseudomonadota bacterium]
MKPISFTAISILAFIYADNAMADAGDKRHRHKPPQVAIEACEALVEGDPCGFEGRRGETVDGTCYVPPEKPLVCRPSEPPPRFRLRDDRQDRDAVEDLDDAT